MIIENKHKIETNIQGSTEFSVSSDSAKIFSFLSNFLYKDKERSVITELCSNALDAHVAVGKKDVPIEICLPGGLQQEFRVRDYGTGLSKEHVYRFLTKYGESSKGDSNDFIGGFGIGSKSPAAVTDTWTINSHHNGVLTSYLIHVNAAGIPNINTLFSKETSETGLEVIVPVKNTARWKTAAQLAFEFYDVMPKTICGTMLHNTKFSGAYRDIVKFAENSYLSNNHVLMNRRAYSLDLQKLGVILPFTTRSYIIFDTSSLSVSLSREDLQYDNKTIDAVKNRIAEINILLQSDWRKDVSIYTDIFKYQVAAAKFKREYNLTAGACDMYATANKDTCALMVNFNNLNTFNIQVDCSIPHSATFVNVIRSSDMYRTNMPRVSRNHSKSSSLVFTSAEYGDVTFVLNDDRVAKSKIKYAIQNKKIKTAILLSKEWFDVIPSCFEKMSASSLDKAPSKPRAVSDKTKIKSNLYNIDGRRFIKMLESDIDQTVPTVCILFTDAKTTSSIVDDNHRKFINDNAWSFKKTEVNFVFATSSDNIPSYSITLDEYITLTYNKLSALLPKIREQFLLDYFTTVSSSSLMGYLYIRSNMFYGIPSNSVCGEVITEAHRIRTIKSDLTLRGMLDILNICESYLKKPITVLSTPNYIEKIMAAYPMIGVLRVSYYTDHQIEVIRDYIKLCGK